MKYKVFCGGNKCKVLNGGHVYILCMGEPASQSVPVATGGSFLLSNGDTLYINEEYGGLDPWGSGEPEYEGIGLSLDSGNVFISYLLIPDNISDWPQCQESGYGAFYDLHGLEYEQGNIIKIYDIDSYNIYEVGNMFWIESAYLEYGLECTAILVLENNQWVLTTESRYVGKTLTLASGEEVYVSGPSAEDGIGIYFTISSGRVSTSYYYQESSGTTIAHSSYNWFSPIIPANGDEIHIYVYDEGEDYNEFGWDTDWSDESTISELIPCLCKLRVVNGEWTILEDHSND